MNLLSGKRIDTMSGGRNGEGGQWEKSLNYANCFDSFFLFALSLPVLLQSPLLLFGSRPFSSHFWDGVC